MPPHIITSEQAFAKILARNPAARPAAELWPTLTPEPVAKTKKPRKKP